MSYLIRTGNNRNDVSFGGGTTTSAKYLQRTGNNRNDISFINISSNSTKKVLERFGTGRNDVRWSNTTFTFETPFTKFASTIYWGNIYSNSDCASLGSWSIYDRTQQIMKASFQRIWNGLGALHNTINFQPYNTSNMEFLRSVKQIDIKFNDENWLGPKNSQRVFTFKIDGGNYCCIEISLIDHSFDRFSGYGKEVVYIKFIT